MEKDILSEWKQTKKTEIAILIPDKIDFKLSVITRD